MCAKCEKEAPEGAAFCPWCGKKLTPSPRNVKKRGNGQGSVYKQANGTWKAAICIYAGGYRYQRSKEGFRTKKEALAYLPILQGRVPAPAGTEKQLRLVEAYNMWQKTRKYENLSVDKKSHYTTAWNRLGKLHYREFHTLRFDELQEVVNQAPGEYYPKRDIKTLLSHLYKIAIREEAITPLQDRTQYIELPETPKSTREVFSSDEIQALWTDYEAGNAFAGYALDMIYTGMRPGELRHMEKKDIHLNERYMIGGSKTEAGRNRIIPIADIILPVITKQYESCKNGLIDLSEDEFYDEWRRLIARTHIRDLPPYSCRHSAITALTEAGAEKAAIMEIVGHTDYKTTFGYTHISIDKKLEAVNKLNEGQSKETDKN